MRASLHLRIHLPAGAIRSWHHKVRGGLAILAAEELYISRSADHIQYVHGEWHLKLEVAQGVVLHQVLGRGRRDRTLKLLEPFAQRELVPHRAPHARRANELK